MGFTPFMSAPKGALVWIFLSLAVTYAAQALGAVVLGAGLSGFIGAVVVAPFTRLASHFRTSLPASVMSLAPGAIVGISLSRDAGRFARLAWRGVSRL